MLGFFRRKSRPAAWKPPAPECAFLVACAAGGLPSPSALVHPQGEGEVLRGTVVPAAGRRLDAVELDRPLRIGMAFTAVTPEAALVEVRAESREALPSDPARALARESWPHVRLNEELFRRISGARAAVTIRLGQGGTDAARDVLFATRLADRVSALAEGCAYDPLACRFFGSGSWRAQEPIGDLDPRDHVQIHAETGGPEGLWLHTHGLAKFGRPEFEIYGVPEDLLGPVSLGLLDMSAYVMGGALIRPGETIGAPEVPLLARAGVRNRQEHWRDRAVLEFVDPGPSESGALKGLRAWVAFRS